MLLDLKKRLEISNSHFPSTCLKCDNCVSGMSFRHKDEKSWGGKHNACFSPSAKIQNEYNDLQVAPSAAERNAMISEKSSTFFFSNCVKEWEENTNSCSQKIWLGAWSLSSAFEVEAEKKMKPRREPRGPIRHTECCGHQDTIPEKRFCKITLNLHSDSVRIIYTVFQVVYPCFISRQECKRCL